MSSKLDSWKDKVKLPTFKKSTTTTTPPNQPVNNPIWVGDSSTNFMQYGGDNNSSWRSSPPPINPSSSFSYSDSQSGPLYGNNSSTYNYSPPPHSSSVQAHQFMSDTTTFAAVPPSHKTVQPELPPTPYPTPNITSPVSGYSDLHSLPETQYLRLVSQLQQEKASHGITKNQLDRYPEEKAQLLKEINNLKYQKETLEKDNYILTQTLEDYNQKKEKFVTELNKLQSQDPDKLNLQSQLESQKNAQLNLTIEYSKLKARIDNTQKSINNLSGELSGLRSGIEKEKSAIGHLEKENLQYKDNWGKLEETLESEKTGKFALLREIQELKKQIKSITDLNSKVEFLERKTKEEQSKRTELETRYIELENQFNDLSQRRIILENFGFSNTNKQTSVSSDTSTSVLMQEELQTDSPLLYAEIPTENNT
jgi:predicted  nucleic acid-binding Zn-ribbon protein